jgi:glycosyltransferase involved in cell wall biosynthesis
MHILMLTQFYHPTVGGIETHVRTLSLALANSGHSVAVATLWREGLPEFELDENVRVYRIRSTTRRLRWLFTDQDRPHVPPLPDPEALTELVKIVRVERPDIVHAHNWLIHTFLPLKQWSGAKLVLTLHDFSFICAQTRLMRHHTPCDGPQVLKCLECSTHHYGPLKGASTYLANSLMRIPEMRRVDLYIAVSKTVADGNQLEEYNLPHTIIPNFVPTHVEGPDEDVATYTQLLPTGEYILLAGDLSRDKGVHIALAAYAQLRNAPPLVMIGRRGDDFPDHLPDGVVVLEPWPHYAIKYAWRGCMFGLAPSTWKEPFGLVSLECMSAGRPLIASDIGALHDIVVHGVTGLLVPPGDVAALREAMDHVLHHGAVREQMGHAARERVRMFAVDTVIPRIEAAYTTLLNDVMARATDHGIG